MQIFLACPFTGHLRAVGFDEAFRRLVERIEQRLLGAGHTVFLTHRTQDFGRQLGPPQLCTPMDLLQMHWADCVVAVPGHSCGMHIELGWAGALGRPIVLLLDEGAPSAFLPLDGLTAVTAATKVYMPPDILESPAAQDRTCDEVLAHLQNVCSPPPASRWAFVSTSFGFGPVSKAVSVARELRRQSPDSECHFFGSGVDLDFARASGVFHWTHHVDVDDPDTVRHLAVALRECSGTFSVMNHLLIDAWPIENPPLYLVDSLTWMWPRPPASLEKVSRVFVQDYLLPNHRLVEWRDSSAVTVVSPIHEASRDDGLYPHHPSTSLLLVNFSGCANPFGAHDLYKRYVEVLSDAIVEEADGRFKSIVFCCNRRLAAHIEQRHRRRPEVSAGHLAPAEFRRLMTSAARLLTAPGITTTLEALAVGVPPGFLLPQNYSQALLSERYRRTLGDRSCMALSRFDEAFAVTPMLSEEEGMARVLNLLEHVLACRRDDIRSKVAELLHGAPATVLDGLEANVGAAWRIPGQVRIVSEVIGTSELTLVSDV